MPKKTKITKVKEVEKSKELVEDHLLELFSETDESRKIVKKLMKRFVSAQEEDEGLVVVFDYEYDDDGLYVTFCNPYKEGFGDSVSPEVESLSRIHNGIYWDSYGGGEMGFNGVYEGELSEGSWEPEFLEESMNEDECEEFFSNLEEKGYPRETVLSPFSYGQNWIVAHPFEENELREEQLYFIDHEDCIPIKMESTKSLSLKTVVLYALAGYVLGENYLPEASD